MKKIINFIRTYAELTILLTVVIVALVVFIKQQHTISAKPVDTQDYNLIYLHNY